VADADPAPAQALSAPADSGAGAPPEQASAGHDPLAAQLAQAPQYDFALLLDWQAQDPAGETLDPEEIRRRWAQVASADYSAPADDLGLGAALGWRLAGGLAAVHGVSAIAQFNGLGLASGVPPLESFKGLNEGFANL